MNSRTGSPIIQEGGKEAFKNKKKIQIHGTWNTMQMKK
jgi:hypothetical protein